MEKVVEQGGFLKGGLLVGELERSAMTPNKRDIDEEVKKMRKLSFNKGQSSREGSENDMGNDVDKLGHFVAYRLEKNCETRLFLGSQCWLSRCRKFNIRM